MTLAGRPLHDQEFAVGPGVPGWRGPAVTGGRRALGTLLVVAPGSPALPPALPTADAAVMPLSPGAVLLAALADDALTLRRCLDRGLTGLPTPRSRTVTG
ncbi:hypothetical protein ACH4ND_14385 [Streptomyces sp. NPDC017179]|uniref:hypothetical protein n=1 Tax=Streptomyces sp. NPDC017179 TaxID=3364979 RepID=UPI0037A2D754